MVDKIVVVMGPTAVGKTLMALEIARQYAGEIISADSMQVYCGMDIGTAKPSRKVRDEIPHHLIDIIKPTETFSVGEFKARARRAIQAAIERDRLPIVVGGTNLYLHALLYDYELAEVPADPERRCELIDYAKEHGTDRLHDWLREWDPPSAATIHPNDLQRIVRALEVQEVTGWPMSKWKRWDEPRRVYHALKIGLFMRRPDLYERIDRRVDWMLERGLVAEVKRLLETYGFLGPTAAQALGYKEVLRHLEGKIDRATCRSLMQRNTRRFAKRQLTWLRKESDVCWFDRQDPDSRCAVLQKIDRWLKAGE